MPSKEVKFDAVIERLPKKGSMHVINVPESVYSKFSDRKTVRIFCTLSPLSLERGAGGEGEIKYACALRPNGEGGFFINVATPILNKAKLKVGQKIKVSIKKDDTEYGHTVPEELTELLAQDKEGKQYWDQVPNSAQRSMIYYIAQAKSIEKRIERSLLFINRLKDTKGKWKPG